MTKTNQLDFIDEIIIPDPAGVSLTDASEYMAKMYTGPDYGCVNYEEKK